MAQYILKKSPALCGEASVQRSKNAVLPMMACCLMTQEPIELCNVPQLTDVDCMAALLTDLGAKVTRQREDVTLCGDAAGHGCTSPAVAPLDRAPLTCI